MTQAVTQRMPVQQQPRSNTRLVDMAAGLALVAVVLTNWYLAQVRAETHVASITIYRLNRAVESGERITRADLTAHTAPEWAREAFGRFIPTDDLPNYLDRDTVRRSAEQGAVLTYQMFLAEERGGTVRIEPGKRGVPLPVGAESVPGVLRPGMFVDIVGTFNRPEGDQVTRLVMERVRVVAMGAQTEATELRQTGAFRTLTIELEPEEAVELTHIRKRMGREGFELLLREAGDVSTEFTGINPEVRSLVGLR